ncbi:MAG: VOC family protein, partial [Pseudomonadota bacterium]|nr:VOC family protein [Pseudomonadota bacterium]
AVRARLDAMGVEIFERLNFRDPWGNRVEVVPYDNIQFTKAPAAMEELRAKGMWREDDAP